MFQVEKLAKTIGGMSVPGMITVVILSAFALAAFTIWVVAGISRLPQP